MQVQAPIEWLLEGEPFIQYRTRLDLLCQSEEQPEVSNSRRQILADARVKGIVTELSNWPWHVISSHKSAGQPFHKLTFLADLGVTQSDPGVDIITSRILEHQSSEGPFQLPANIPVHFGGSGQDTWAWALCDAPLIVYALAKLGLHDDPQVNVAVSFLTDLVRDNGWPCAVSKELGKFHGPGRRDDPCPFATLAMLKMLSAVEEWRGYPEAQHGVEALLALWDDSTTTHPYMFFMGTDFRKLKVPFIWYDLEHVLDVLSAFPWVRGDRRLLDMVQVLRAKMDESGRFTNESVWTAWKEWEFGQKKEPSRWLTLISWRILDRFQAGTFIEP